MIAANGATAEFLDAQRRPVDSPRAARAASAGIASSPSRARAA